MSNRQDRIDYARHLITRDPNIGKRGLQRALKTEFGVGLSDTARRGLLQQANTPGVLRARINTPTFTHYERAVLRKILHRTGSTPYLARAVNARYIKGREARDAGISKREFMHQVRQEAKEAGYLATKTTQTRAKPDGTIRGQVDWWKLLRDYRDMDVDRGDYVPKQQPRPKTDKGDIKAQKIRYEDRQSTKAHTRWVERERSRVRTWITQKERAIAVSSGPQRQGLEAQLANLKQTLRGIR